MEPTFFKPPLLPNRPLGADPKKRQRSSNRQETTSCSVLEWSEFFLEKELVRTERGTFNVYLAGPSDAELLVVPLHGGGYSGLSWACFAEELCRLVRVRVMAMDIRGHGSSTTNNDEDLSAETVVGDIKAVLEALLGEKAPNILLMGHSMGGAMAVEAATSGVGGSKLAGIVVVDVVEGSALSALSSMQRFLRSRPQRFDTVEKAIEWCLNSGTVLCRRSARVSMPSQIRPIAADWRPSSSSTSDVLKEEPELEGHGNTEEAKNDGENGGYSWAIDLSKTEKYWTGWFAGLSAKFLQVPAPKLLLLAGVDRLDKTLTVAQMQGKFQMVVLPKVGHVVHEDSPELVAEAVAKFCKRHRLVVDSSSE